MMAATANPIPDLTGKKVRCWLVLAYAGERDGVHYWRCMCRASLAEKVIAEHDVLDRKLNVVSAIPRHWREACANPTGWIYGEWTVIGPVGGQEAESSGQSDPIWKCRCACGTDRDIPRSALTPPGPRTPSCGCRPDAEVWNELLKKRWQARSGWKQACGATSRRSRERRLDRNWTPEMKQALYTLQPACVLCGTTDNPTTHHVQALSEGHGLKPGNAVRLCRACNSFIYTRDLSELAPSQVSKLERAAAEFKECWQDGHVKFAVRAPAAVEKTPRLPDLKFIELLRAVESGDDAALPALANWLEQRGDPRATAIRQVTRSEAVRDDELWARLGLSLAERRTLKSFLGISATGLPSTVEEIARQHGVTPQTARNRIELALHRLSV